MRLWLYQKVGHEARQGELTRPLICSFAYLLIGFLNPNKSSLGG